MPDDLDPAAVERAARAAFVASVLPEHRRYAEQNWDTLCASHLDRKRWERIARAALAAARDGQAAQRPTCCQGWEWVPSGVGEPHNGAPERYDREPCAHVVDEVLAVRPAAPTVTTEQVDAAVRNVSSADGFEYDPDTVTFVCGVLDALRIEVREP